MQSSLKTWQKVLGLALVALCVAPAGAAPVPAPRAAQGVEADTLAPADTEFLMVVDIQQMLGSPLVKKYGLEDARAALKKNEQADKMLTATGLDPFKDLDTITLAGSGTAAKAKMLVVVRGRFDLDKVHAAAEDFAKQKPGQLKVSKEGDVQFYELKGKGTDKPAFAAFADKNTLVLSPSKDYTLEAVEKAGKAPAKLNPEMKEALGRLSGKESLWVAAVITDEAKRAMGKSPMLGELGAKLESISGGVTLTDAVALSLLVHTSDAKAAALVKKKVNDFKPLLTLMAQSNEEAAPLVNDLLDNLKVNTEKTDVRISLKITEEMMEKAAKMKGKDKDSQ
jgi:hypothetical protein